MEFIKFKSKLTDMMRKYKYAILVLVIGLILITMPEIGKIKNQSISVSEHTESISETPLEEELSELLSHVEGAGNVKVMLTVASGEEVIYQVDENRSVADNTNSGSTQTITITDSDRNQTGLVKQVNPKMYKGAIILCQGADNPTVRLDIVEAVSRITGLGTNCISILKMK